MRFARRRWNRIGSPHGPESETRKKNGNSTSILAVGNPLSTLPALLSQFWVLKYVQRSFDVCLLQNVFLLTLFFKRVDSGFRFL